MIVRSAEPMSTILYSLVRRLQYEIATSLRSSQ